MKNVLKSALDAIRTAVTAARATNAAEVAEEAANIGKVDATSYQALLDPLTTAKGELDAAYTTGMQDLEGTMETQLVEYTNATGEMQANVDETCFNLKQEAEDRYEKAYRAYRNLVAQSQQAITDMQQAMADAKRSLKQCTVAWLGTEDDEQMIDRMKSSAEFAVTDWLVIFGLVVVAFILEFTLATENIKEIILDNFIAMLISGVTVIFLICVSIVGARKMAQIVEVWKARKRFQAFMAQGNNKQVYHQVKPVEMKSKDIIVGWVFTLVLFVGMVGITLWRMHLISQMPEGYGTGEAVSMMVIVIWAIFTYFLEFFVAPSAPEAFANKVNGLWDAYYDAEDNIAVQQWMANDVPFTFEEGNPGDSEDLDGLILEGSKNYLQELYDKQKTIKEEYRTAVAKLLKQGDALTKDLRGTCQQIKQLDSRYTTAISQQFTASKLRALVDGMVRIAKRKNKSITVEDAETVINTYLDEQLQPIDTFFDLVEQAKSPIDQVSLKESDPITWKDFFQGVEEEVKLDEASNV